MGKEGDVGELKIRIDGFQGDEKCTWFKNNLKIDDPECKKYNMEYDASTGIGKLYIMDINKSDDGQYKVKVDNGYFGASFAECEVAVETRKNGWTRDPRKIFTARKAKRGNRGRESFAVRRPPEFTLPLYNKSVYIGEEVVFAVTVTVHPEPEITWLHDGQKIILGKEESRREIKREKGLYSFIIKKAEIEDLGNYTVVAKNPSGEAQCTAMLTVSKKPEP